MNVLPAGWQMTKLGELLERIEAGRSFAGETRPARSGEWGIIKVSAMTYGSFRENDNKAVPPGTVVSAEAEIRPADLLVSRANTRDYVGASVLVGAVRPRLLLSDKSLRLHPRPDIDRRWLWYALSAPQARRYLSDASTGVKASMRNISQEILRSLPILLPPQMGQQRIVEILEDHLSRLDVAARLLETAARRSQALTKSVLMDLVPDVVDWPSRWVSTTVGAAGHVELGRQRHPDWHTGSNMHPYLRVANVFENRIDASDVMEMHWPGDSFERFKLLPGDVLLNEGQSPELLGRPALYRGYPANVAFTNSLLRFKADERIRPAFALLVFRRHMHAGRFARESRITTNIAHLSAARLKSVEFPVPPMAEQERIVGMAADRLHATQEIASVIETSRKRSVALTRALLAAAFSGRLTGASSDLDQVEEMAGV